jgi:hypothetical protein
MGQMRERTTLPVPPATVYRFVADLHNAPRFITAIKGITSGPTDPPAVGQQFKANAVFMGQPERITLRVLRLTPDREVAFALDGDPAGTILLRLSAAGSSSTHIEISMDVPSVPTLLLSLTLGRMLSDSLRGLRSVLCGG